MPATAFLGLLRTAIERGSGMRSRGSTHTIGWRVIRMHSSGRGARSCGFSTHTNVSGWKAHLKKHNVLAPGSEVGTSASASRLIQQTLSRPAIPDRLLVKFENAVVDFVIQGAISLRAAGSDKFKTFGQHIDGGIRGPIDPHHHSQNCRASRHHAAHRRGVLLQPGRRHLAHHRRVVEPQPEGILDGHGALDRQQIWCVKIHAADNPRCAVRKGCRQAHWGRSV